MLLSCKRVLRISYTTIEQDFSTNKMGDGMVAGLSEDINGKRDVKRRS